MGLSLEGGGGGRTRSLYAELNLVPFIDLLTVCITFLMATAVWTQISTMKVDQAISDPNAEPVEPETPPVPPLTIHIRADGVWMGRTIEAGKNFELTGADYDWVAIALEADTDRETYPEETQVVIVTDDGIEYEHMIKALDVSRAKGYDKTLLGGGPAAVGVSLQPLGEPG
jgi:biopolymer transport protein ExbD